MYHNQRKLTEDLLFNYYMISSLRENEVFCPTPFYIDKKSFDLMISYAEILDNLVLKILKGINDEHKSFQSYIDNFSYKSDIFSLSTNITPVFWTRYDAFKKDDGGIFFSEFNYDKPCAQREIIFSSNLHPKNDPNVMFAEKFKKEFYKIVYNKFSCNSKIVTAVLIDPCHYEELHLSHLFMDLLTNSSLEIIPVGPKNLYVKNDKVYAFHKKIDIILRLYPTEFLYEVNDFDKILKLFNEDKVFIVNDPRIIICQAKSLFAYLWQLAITNSNILTKEEVNAIKKSIPYTQMFDIHNKDLMTNLYTNKNLYVLKSVLGRYSEEVYIGALCSMEEWCSIIELIKKSAKLHIVQQFCPIHKDLTYKVSEMSSYIPVEAYGNFGIYLIDGKFSGSCIRWSENYLTLDDTTWITPIGIIEHRFQLKTLYEKNRKSLWQSIYENAMINYDFTGGYTREMEYFSLQSLILSHSLYTELRNSSEKICAIFRKTQKLVLDNPDILLTVLGIDENLEKIINRNFTEALCCIGRLDWVLDVEGNLKLLEFNSETPAGIAEAIGLNRIIKDELSVPYLNPCNNLASNFKLTFERIIEDYNKLSSIKTIAFLTSTYYEDWFNTKILYDLVKDMPYKFILANVFDAKFIDKKLYLYGEPIDAVYRYYPLDWFIQNIEMKNYITAFENNTLSINPPHTLITQNKAFFALIYELLKIHFFNKEESELIKKYIPYTTLNLNDIKFKEFCTKPFFGREGENVQFDYEHLDIPKDGVIYQEKINIKPLDIEVYFANKMYKKIKFPIIGAFITNDKFSGIYTRCGDLVTDKWANFISTYIDNL